METIKIELPDNVDMTVLEDWQNDVGVISSVVASSGSSNCSNNAAGEGA